MGAPTTIPEKKVCTETIGNGGFVLDMRHFPVIVLAWIDEISVPLLERMIELREPYLVYADQIGAKVICIIDTNQMQVPSATVRKHSADVNLKDRNHPCFHAYIGVMGSAVMRGVATAINWITGDKGIPSSLAPNIESAMLSAQRIYEELGIDFKRPDNYQVPFPQKK